ncbi:sugar-binding transcriptional regulator [Metabacillus arenae]|uniref:Sugar-binding transcriptional regulator n=1 Tax=Metabacillus arenae TaxID=2771434 RepID=A0A926NFT2_9BACI|nr:sugar-binding transcriptional regulator [Metabacillus arenae]MBD1383497.1 sugar-binding transcriptional regulator [Metabacillus arenae]
MDWEERKEIVKIAIFYYYKNLTQDQIAKKLNVSRSVISRSLQKAKDYGIINFYIKDESFPIVNMQSELEEKFRLKKVIISPSYNLLDHEVLNLVIKEAIAYLKVALKNVNTVGVSWGSTLKTLAREFPYEDHKHLTLLPLIGGISKMHIELHSNQICYDLMKKLYCHSNFLYAPALAENTLIKKTFCESPSISEVLEAGRNVDMALLGIASPYANDNLMRRIGYTTNLDLKEFESLNVVGDINSRFFNQEGTEVNCRINNHVIGISLEDIKNIPNIVLIASGIQKKEAVLAAVKAGYAHTLIIDERIADYLLHN